MLRPRVLIAVFAIVFSSGWCQGFGQDRQKVKSTSPMKATINRTLRIAGSVSPFEEATVFAKATGYVLSVDVDRGDQVERGQRLVSLSIPEALAKDKILLAEIGRAAAAHHVAQANVSQAKSQLAAATAQSDAAAARLEAAHVGLRFAQLELKRTQALFSEGSTTQKQLDHAAERAENAKAKVVTAKSDVTVARAGIASAQAKVGASERQVDLAKSVQAAAEATRSHHQTLMKYGTVYAPFDGVIAKRFVHTGALVLGGANNSNPTPLFHVIRDDKVRVIVPLPQSEIAHIAVGAKVTIDGVGFEGDPITGQVAIVSAMLSRGNRTLPIEIHSQDKRLKPGLGVYVRVALEKHANVLTLPSSCIHYHKKQAFVWTVESGTVKRINVNIGFDDLVRAEVDGLKVTSVVVVSTKGGLQDGKLVTVVKPGSKK